MKNYNEDFEEKENMNDNFEGGKFQKVPIEDTQNNSIEIYNVYTGVDLSKEKCKKKLIMHYL